MRKSYIFIFAITAVITLMWSILKLSFADEGIDLLKRLEGSFWMSHILWIFSPNGNAGKITMLSPTQELTANGSGVYLDTKTNTLTGQFYLETVWYVSVWVNGYPVTLTPPIGDTVNILEPWKVTGFAWSENAGWITLDSVDGSYTGVYYLPDTQKFSGFAWSDTLGFLEFSDSNALDFLWKVKILWNIGGNNSFDVLYSLWAKFNSSSHTDTLNKIRKNVAIITRWAPNTSINIDNTYAAASDLKSITNELVYFKLKESDRGKYVLMWAGWNDILKAKNTRTLIIEWGDLYINGDITENVFLNKSRSIIVVKDSSWKGGNIYIEWSVKKIHASLIAEWTIYSGYPSSAQAVTPIVPFLYNDTKAKVTNLPANQLYIYGNVISRNTIGGSAEVTSGKNGSCPYTEDNCNRDTAIKYDLNYFRWYNKEATRRAYKDNTLDNFSVIIESDSRIVSDPPPGLLAK